LEPSRTEPSAPTPELDAVAIRTRNFDRILFVRHLAIFAGALAAYYQHARYGMGTTAFTVVTISAAANFACSFVYRRPGLRLLAELASPMIGVGCWTALAAATGGPGSLYVAGLWLEIILVAGLFEKTGIVVVTASSILGIAVLALSSESSLIAALLQGAFLLGMGSLAYTVTGHALSNEADLVRERNVLDERLQNLAHELEHEKRVGSLGEGVARLAHGLKNTVHSLRGFAALIEPTIADRQGASAALDGLRLAIDDLEALARLTLEPEIRVDDRAPLGPVLERCIAEIQVSHPAVSIRREANAFDEEIDVAIAERELAEVILALLRNGVEAMEGRGEVVVHAEVENGRLRFDIHDSGPGIAPETLERAFEPGFTTKPEGSGYGLFLARRVAEKAGGSLGVQCPASGGTKVRLELRTARDIAAT
jgi:signal transduction histidine kinase